MAKKCDLWPTMFLLGVILLISLGHGLTDLVQHETILAEMKEIHQENQAIKKQLKTLQGQTYGAQMEKQERENEERQLQRGLAAAQRTIKQTRDLPDMNIAEVRKGMLWLNDAVTNQDVVFLVALKDGKVIANLKNKSNRGHNGTTLPEAADQFFLTFSRPYSDETGSGHRTLFKQVILIE